MCIGAAVSGEGNSLTEKGFGRKQNLTKSLQFPICNIVKKLTRLHSRIAADGLCGNAGERSIFYRFRGVRWVSTEQENTRR
jgi:hypothetical protein